MVKWFFLAKSIWIFKSRLNGLRLQRIYFKLKICIRNRINFNIMWLHSKMCALWITDLRKHRNAPSKYHFRTKSCYTAYKLSHRNGLLVLENWWCKFTRLFFYFQIFLFSAGIKRRISRIFTKLTRWFVKIRIIWTALSWEMNLDLFYNAFENWVEYWKIRKVISKEKMQKTWIW
jgi:hypothetical protein